MKVATVSQMRTLDRTAMERYAVPEEILMENAGLATYAALVRETGVVGKRFLILCAVGNNGGDGLVVARKIHSNGGEARIFVLGNPQKYKGAAAANLEMATRLGIPLTVLKEAKELEPALRHCHGVVDALFGTGLDRAVGGLFAEVIERVNQAGRWVLSVDIPSGIHGDTGKVMGTAIRADVTVTYGLPKLGNLLYPGYHHGGRLYVTHISFPPELTQADELAMEINLPDPLPPRPREAHKGSVGDVLFVAGAYGYMGAPYFSAISFLKSGGGYARLAAPRGITPFVAVKGSEIVFLPQEESPSGGLALGNLERLFSAAEKVDMVVVGPGLSLDPETQELVRRLAARVSKPLLLDGDGITAVCEELELIKARTSPTILTPHPGEMSRITKRPVPAIDADKVGVVRETAARLKAIVVLKGAHSLIGYPDGRLFINMTGNPGMATAGSGDVLTGTVAAMFGMGMDLESAVRKGVLLHGLAGDLAAEALGEDGITAQDILEHLPLALKEDRGAPRHGLHARYLGLERIL